MGGAPKSTQGGGGKAPKADFGDAGGVKISEPQKKKGGVKRGCLPRKAGGQYIRRDIFGPAGRFYTPGGGGVVFPPQKRGVFSWS